MEDRYEIKAKIGQGGFGSVYRAFDKRMSRDVAIKRINTSDEDGMLEEASRQLSKEAGALASIQHPNIITVYDVGSDEDGPYVVMELLTGSPLDELVDKAPLTWEDFRELAMQSQEALIGAQELDLVHRDIKPANVMLSWLPSGKFQVKLLDFGLAKLTQRPSLQTLNQADSIFGSIFFMSPEQFERAPIDRRTDMYAMGCVYYYALTGSHPFDGATAVEVMSAHLHHDFLPLNEVRPDLPKWVSDWVMWHMNRYPDDRPISAREALQVFVQNDKYPPIEAPPPATDQVRRPRLLIPGAAPLVPGATVEKKPETTSSVQLITKTAPQPLIPPTGKPSVHSSRQIDVEQVQMPKKPIEPTDNIELPADGDPSSEDSAETAPPEVREEIPAQEPEPVVEKPVRKLTLIQKNPAVAPPFGGAPARANPLTSAAPAAAANPAPTVIKRPTLMTAARPATGLQTAVVPATSTQPTVDPATAPPPALADPMPSALAINPQPAALSTAAQPITDQSTPAHSDTAAVIPAFDQKPKSNSVKIASLAIVALLVLLVGWFVVQKISTGKVLSKYNELITLAAHPETTSVPMDKAMLDMMLLTAMNIRSNTERETVFRALYLASATDGTDIDAKIMRFATEEQMMENVRKILINQVLRRRGNPQIVTPLLEFVSTTDKDDAAVAALEAVRYLVDESHFDVLLGRIQFTSNVEIRRAAEAALVEVIEKSSGRENFTPKLHGVFNSSVNDDARHAALRLSARVADDASLNLIREIFSGRNIKDQIAAISALSSWRNTNAFPVLINFINKTDDSTLSSSAFEAALRFASKLDDESADEAVRNDVWTQLALTARNPEEQERLVRMLGANHRDEWVIPLLQTFTDKKYNARVVDVAERAIISVRSRRDP